VVGLVTGCCELICFPLFEVQGVLSLGKAARHERCTVDVQQTHLVLFVSDSFPSSSSSALSARVSTECVLSCQQPLYVSSSSVRTSAMSRSRQSTLGELSEEQDGPSQG
jgi:hypothetical protein